MFVIVNMRYQFKVISLYLSKSLLQELIYQLEGPKKALKSIFDGLTDVRDSCKDIDSPQGPADARSSTHNPSTTFSCHKERKVHA